MTADCDTLLHFVLQVCLADVQSRRGEATTKEFQEEFGQDRAVFVKCDVTSFSELHSMKISTWHINGVVLQTTLADSCTHTLHIIYQPVLLPPPPSPSPNVRLCQGLLYHSQSQLPFHLCTGQHNNRLVSTICPFLRLLCNQLFHWSQQVKGHMKMMNTALKNTNKRIHR